jgi:hypothetical protein
VLLPSLQELGQLCRQKQQTIPDESSPKAPQTRPFSPTLYFDDYRTLLRNTSNPGTLDSLEGETCTFKVYGKHGVHANFDDLRIQTSKTSVRLVLLPIESHPP